LLLEEGLLDRNRQLEFPVLPLTVGLITSDQSAAYFDFVNEVTGDGHPFRITLFDTRVQGVEAVDGIVASITQAGATNDVVVVVRGGGSRTDLAVFDHGDVARAVAHCPVPVLVGVGHDVDRSVADEVAHQSLKTPTAAARFLVEAVDRYQSRILGAAERLEHLARWHVAAAGQRLMANATQLAVTARRRVATEQAELAHTRQRLSRAPTVAVQQATADLRIHRARLDALDPARALRRGWTITYRVSGGDRLSGGDRTLLTGPDEVSPGDILETVTARGTVHSTVINTANNTVTSTTDSVEDEGVT